MAKEETEAKDPANQASNVHRAKIYIYGNQDNFIPSSTLWRSISVGVTGAFTNFSHCIVWPTELHG